MAKWVCEQCGAPFVRDKSGSRPVRFCGVGCYRDWRKTAGPLPGCFRPGNVPWTKGRKGIHLSPATEFKKGESNKRLPLGSERVRIDKNGAPRAFVKTDVRSWEMRAKVVWERHCGAIPAGMVIHHKDRNSLNDSIGNLEILTRAEHLNEHRAEIKSRNNWT